MAFRWEGADLRGVIRQFLTPRSKLAGQANRAALGAPIHRYVDVPDQFGAYEPLWPTLATDPR